MSPLAMQLAALDEDKVSPGLLGFTVVAVLAVATWILLRSMTKQLKRVDFEEKDNRGDTGGGQGVDGAGGPDGSPGRVGGDAAEETEAAGKTEDAGTTRGVDAAVPTDTADAADPAGARETQGNRVG